MTLQISANSAFTSPVTNMDKSVPRVSPTMEERCARCNRLTDRCSCSPESRQQSPPTKKGLAFSVDSILAKKVSTSNPTPTPPPPTSLPQRTDPAIVTPTTTSSYAPSAYTQEEVDSEEEINVQDDIDDRLSDHTSERDSSSPRSLTPETASSPSRGSHGHYPLAPGMPDARLGLPGAGHIPPHPFLAAEAAKWPGIGGVSLSWLPGFTSSPRKYRKILNYIPMKFH
jgi:hypothetical protein